MSVLQKDEQLTASTDVRASADQVYAVVSDVTRIPEWSPETARAEWSAPDRFNAWNRRRLGRWRTTARVVEAEPGHRFSFIVQVMGRDWTQWTYRIEPGTESGSGADATRLTEEFRMCVPMPFGVLAFERLFLFVWDRRIDLQNNLQVSVDRIRAIVEAGIR
jgi:Polyketide cyclase / dehydrase and lipid transport